MLDTMLGHAKIKIKIMISVKELSTCFKADRPEGSVVDGKTRGFRDF